MYCFSFTLPARQGQHRFACNCCFRHAPLPSGLYWILPQTESPRPAAFHATCTGYNVTILRGISWSHKTKEAPLYAAQGQWNIWDGREKSHTSLFSALFQQVLLCEKSICEFEKAVWYLRRQGSPETKGYEAACVGPVESHGAVVTNECLHGSLGWPCSISGGGDH